MDVTINLGVSPDVRASVTPLTSLGTRFLVLELGDVRIILPGRDEAAAEYAESLGILLAKAALAIRGGAVDGVAIKVAA